MQSILFFLRLPLQCRIIRKLCSCDVTNILNILRCTVVYEIFLVNLVSFYFLFS